MAEDKNIFDDPEFVLRYKAIENELQSSVHAKRAVLKQMVEQRWGPDILTPQRAFAVMPLDELKAAATTTLALLEIIQDARMKEREVFVSARLIYTVLFGYCLKAQLEIERKGVEDACSGS